MQCIASLFMPGMNSNVIYGWEKSCIQRIRFLSSFDMVTIAQMSKTV